MSQTAISQFRARKSNNKRKAEELYIEHKSAGSSATRLTAFHQERVESHILVTQALVSFLSLTNSFGQGSGCVHPIGDS